MLPGEVDATIFETHVALLAAEFNVMTLGDACVRLMRGDLPPRAACITFDDGYADNAEIALPILKRYGLPATFFVAAGFSDGGVMFNDAVIESLRSAPKGTFDFEAAALGRYMIEDDASRRAAADAIIARLMYRSIDERERALGVLTDTLRTSLPRGLMMNPAQIRRLCDEGMEIGGHTQCHPILATLDDGAARAEIVGGKKRLEDIVGSRIAVFAYPNGKPGRDYGRRDVQLVKDAGFLAAVSTARGIAGRGSDVYQLPRFAPWDRNVAKLHLRLILASRQMRVAATAD
jgi:peptidoglycan/xylan/chitin deacetylase (PgdA/CDA1 family)